jgi:hypothetical protein
MLRIHLLPFFGGRSLDAVTPAEVEAFIRLKLREGKSRKTVDHLLGPVSAMYRYAVKRGLARVNPVELADRPRQVAWMPTSATWQSRSSRQSGGRYRGTSSGRWKPCSTWSRRQAACAAASWLRSAGAMSTGPQA